MGLDYQVSFVKAGILQVLTATVSAGPACRELHRHGVGGHDDRLIVAGWRTLPLLSMESPSLVCRDPDAATLWTAADAAGTAQVPGAIRSPASTATCMRFSDGAKGQLHRGS